MRTRRLTCVMAKRPVAGAVKTRMCPPLAPEEAAELGLAMLDDTVAKCAGCREFETSIAAAGELGEACNLIKKLRRGEDVPAIEIAKELADAITYIDLLMYRLGFATGDIVAMKFNEVNARVSCPLMLSND